MWLFQSRMTGNQMSVGNIKASELFQTTLREKEKYSDMKTLTSQETCLMGKPSSEVIYTPLIGSAWIKN